MTESISNQLYSLDAEKSIIGSLLIDNDLYDRISDIISSRDFFNQVNKILYNAIMSNVN